MQPLPYDTSLFPRELTAREEAERIELAEIAAGRFFSSVTKTATAEFHATMEALRGTAGPRWNRERDAARAKFAADTAEANTLYDETVECILTHGEVSADLDERWTELSDRERESAQ